MFSILSNNDLTALYLTLQLALVSTVILLVLGMPLAWWLARRAHRLKPLLEAIIALPLILPPTVIGFYLLIAFSPNSWPAKIWYATFGSNLAFSFSGLVLGSVIYSLPFVVQPLQSSYENVSRHTLLIAASLGANRLDRFRSVIWPMTRRSTVAAAALAFCHTVGEFGIVLMIGGSIPGETQVLSIALFDHVESLNYGGAHSIALLLLLFSFISLFILYSAGYRSTFHAQRAITGLRR
ncbi:MAG: molybdate ABC transporter permease subunit [Pseudomonadales bacterium]|nr:molybdate ABC transporter permease subunit [Pseudomonadales bacterium]